MTVEQIRKHIRYLVADKKEIPDTVEVRASFAIVCSINASRKCLVDEIEHIKRRLETELIRTLYHDRRKELIRFLLKLQEIYQVYSPQTFRELYEDILDIGQYQPPPDYKE